MSFPSDFVAGSQLPAEDLNDYVLNPKYTYGETIAAVKAVYLKASDSKLYKASAATQAHVDAFQGITIQSGVANDTKRILGPGHIVTGLSGLTAGSPVYLQDTAGEVGPNRGTIALQVGIAISTTAMLLIPVFIATQNLDLFGDGSDGDLSNAGTTTLTRDMYYNSVTNSGTINTGGFRIFCKGKLSNTGTIQNNGGAGGAGGNASGKTGGTAGTAGSAGAGGTIASGSAGQLGGTGGTGANDDAVGSGATAGSAGNAGANGANATKAVNSAAGKAGAGGGNSGTTNSGGTGSGGGGGTAGTSSGTIGNSVRTAMGAYLLADISGTSVQQFGVAAGSGGGGGGGGGPTLDAGFASTEAGGGGGGGGGSGGTGGGVVIFARYLDNTGGTIQANGGAGGNGGNGANGTLTSGDHADDGGAGGGGGGGGSGGNGGFVIYAYQVLIAAGTIQATGGAAGTGGTHGNGSGSATNGSDGGTGTAGATGVTFAIPL